MTGLPAPDAFNATGWRAELQLRFAMQDARTVLAQRRHVGPLLVQRPFYPEGEVCHLYVIHPPGGIVGGDHLHLHAQVDAGAHALITTPAATKFYRAAPGKRSVLRQQLRLTSATLEWLPQETIYFNQAQVRTLTRIDLDTASRCIAWEVNCYGRRAGNEPFVSGRVRQGLEVWLNGRPLLLDHLHVEGGVSMQQDAWGLQSNSVLGTLAAYPAGGDDVQAVRALELDASKLGCTLIDGMLLCRCLCDDSAEAKRLLLQVWQCLRPRVLQREVVMPRIWAT